VISRLSWRRLGVLWFALAVMLLTWVTYFFTTVGMVYLEAEQHGQPFQWSEAVLRWVDGSSENLFSEFFITAWLLWFVDRKWSKDRRFAASEED
jgi:glycerol uptake facilitator-like aquaporin